MTMVDFPEFIRPSPTMSAQESLDGWVEISDSKGFTWFVLDVQRDDKYCLTESWPDGLPWLGMPPWSFLSQWINMPWWTMASPELEHHYTWSINEHWLVFISNRRKRGCPDPVLYPSEQIWQDYIGLSKVIMQNSYSIYKTSLLYVSCPYIM